MQDRLCSGRALKSCLHQLFGIHCFIQASQSMVNLTKTSLSPKFRLIICMHLFKQDLSTAFPSVLTEFPRWVLVGCFSLLYKNLKYCIYCLVYTFYLLHNYTCSMKKLLLLILNIVINYRLCFFLLCIMQVQFFIHKRIVHFNFHVCSQSLVYIQSIKNH